MIKLPCSFSSQTVVTLVREVLEELKFKFERSSYQKHYTQIMVLVPLPKFAYTFRFVIKEPKEPFEFIIDIYDVKITHSGLMHFIELEGVRQENIDSARTILKELVRKLPYKPWKFTLAQKFQIGFLAPEIIRARKTWQKFLGLTSE